MKTPQEIADGIVGMIRVAFLELNENMTVEGLAKHNENMKEAVESIADAIQAGRDARPPKGHVLTDDGVVRKVLGTLPMTADGCVATINGTFYTRTVTGCTETTQRVFRPHRRPRRGRESAGGCVPVRRTGGSDDGRHYSTRSSERRGAGRA